MKFLLTLKSWQLFLLIWGIPFLIPLFFFESITPTLFGTFVTIFGTIFFLWLYSIGRYLPEKLNNNIRIPTKSFQIHIWYLIITTIILSFGALFKDVIGQSAGLLFIFIIYYFVAMFIILRYVSKLIASVELSRLATSTDYLGYFLLIWLSPIGIWVIQPKVRRYFAK